MKTLISVICLVVAGYSSAATTVEDLSLNKPNNLVLSQEVMLPLKGIYGMLNVCASKVSVGQNELDLIEKAMLDKRVDWVDVAGNLSPNTENSVKYMRTLYDNDLTYAWSQMKNNSAKRQVFTQNCQTVVRQFHNSEFYQVFSDYLRD